jgi:hypothetical protein
MRINLPVFCLALALSASAATAAVAPPKHTIHASAVPFITDDYTRAVAEAKARKVPLFIEAWAPW